MHTKVYTKRGSDIVMRCSCLSFLVYLNSALINRHSKKQGSVEGSSFGSEFITRKQCCEYICGLCYKLQMMGIPCKCSTYIQGNNQSVLGNCGIPDLTLKKSQSIAYHFVHKVLSGMNGEW